jgi:hypothetical protein
MGGSPHVHVQLVNRLPTTKFRVDVILVTTKWSDVKTVLMDGLIRIPPLIFYCPEPGPWSYGISFTVDFLPTRPAPIPGHPPATTPIPVTFSYEVRS